MYYKKQGNEPPVIKSGCAYEESYFYDGYLFLRYSVGNVPSEELTEITKQEYAENKPEPEPQEPPLSATEQAMFQMVISTEYMVAMMEFNSNGGM